MEKNKKSWKRSVLEWALLIGVFVLLNVTGWNRPISTFLHRAAFAVGLFQPKIPKLDSAPVEADLNMPLRTLSGESANLEDFRGKTVFLNFWATWCPPCLAELPAIQGLFEMMQSENVSIVTVATDQSLSQVKDFLNDRPYTFPVYRLAGSVPKAFLNNTIPATFVIDAEGRIVYRKLGMADYSSEQFKDFLRSTAQK
mgnify:CR=1 FL=1